MFGVCARRSNRSRRNQPLCRRSTAWVIGLARKQNSQSVLLPFGVFLTTVLPRYPESFSSSDGGRSSTAVEEPPASSSRRQRPADVELAPAGLHPAPLAVYQARGLDSASIPERAPPRE